jgi:hypothetical protein
MNASRIAALLAALSPVLVAAQATKEPGIMLGPAPQLLPGSAPPYVQSWAPKLVLPVSPLDTGSRAAVRAAYNTYYNVAQPSVGWTGAVAGCNPGTTAQTFQDWFVTRINFVRSMAGVSGTTLIDASTTPTEQATALLMDANGTLSHSPPSNWTCYTAAGSTGAGSSNLAYGYDALSLYLSDNDPSNTVAGHRRWVLHSAKGYFALGQADSFNALYAFDFSGSGTAPNGIPWPPSGYVPLGLFPSLITPFGGTERWSFGMPNADFSSAAVAMTVNGTPISVTIQSRTDNGYGDNTIVWDLPGGTSITKGTTYDVTITGVAGTSSSSYHYQVLPFDPADPIGAVAMDFNGDAHSDIMYRNVSTGQVYRLIMNGLTVASGAMAYTEPNTLWHIVADGDFNGDGVADLIWRNDGTGQFYFMPFTAAGMPAPGSVFYTEPNPAWRIVATMDVDGDGTSDLVWWNSSTGQVYAMRMAGGAITNQATIYTEPNTNWKIVGSGDFAGSGKKNQLLWWNAMTGQVFLQTVGYSGGTFSTSGTIIYTEPNTTWQIVATADLNADGRTDIVWRNSASGQVFVMLMNGGTITSSGTVYTEPNQAWQIVATGDYNADGKSDLLWRNSTTGQVFMQLMSGLTIAASGMVYTEPNTAWHVMGPREYAQ